MYKVDELFCEIVCDVLLQHFSAVHLSRADFVTGLYEAAQLDKPFYWWVAYYEHDEAALFFFDNENGPGLKTNLPNHAIMKSAGPSKMFHAGLTANKVLEDFWDLENR